MYCCNIVFCGKAVEISNMAMTKRTAAYFDLNILPSIIIVNVINGILQLKDEETRVPKTKVPEFLIFKRHLDQNKNWISYKCDEYFIDVEYGGPQSCITDEKIPYYLALSSVNGHLCIVEHDPWEQIRGFFGMPWEKVKFKQLDQSSDSESDYTSPG